MRRSHLTLINIYTIYNFNVYVNIFFYSVICLRSDLLLFTQTHPTENIIMVIFITLTKDKFSFSFTNKMTQNYLQDNSTLRYFSNKFMQKYFWRIWRKVIKKIFTSLMFTQKIYVIVNVWKFEKYTKSRHWHNNKFFVVAFLYTKGKFLERDFSLKFTYTLHTRIRTLVRCWRTFDIIMMKHLNNLFTYLMSFASMWLASMTNNMRKKNYK